MENKESFGIKTLIKSLLRAFNLKKGVIPTLKDLLIHPHIVSNHYIEGRRERYISPAQLFIVAISLLALTNILSNELEIDKDPRGLIEITEKYEKLEPMKPVFKIMNNSPFTYLFFLIIPFSIITRIISYKSKRTFAMHLVNHMYAIFFIAIFMTTIDIIMGDFLDKKFDNKEEELWQDFIGFTLLISIFFYYTFSFKKFLKDSFILSFSKMTIITITCILIGISIEVASKSGWKLDSTYWKKMGILLLFSILLLLIKKSVTHIKKRIKSN